jgi:hypothetical protein
MNTVTVFVKRAGQHFHAATYAADAMHPSAVHAAQRAAARHFHVEPDEIALDRATEHLFNASVKAADGDPAPAPARMPLLARVAPWLLLFGLAWLLGVGIASTAIILLGGAS